MQFRTILFPYKKCVMYWKENIRKNSFNRLYALSSNKPNDIPFNKLPCLDGSFLATEIFRFFAGLLVLKVSFWFKCSDLQWSLRRSVCKNLAEQSEHWTVKSSGKACSSRKWLQKASIVMWSVFWQPFNWQIITPFSDLSYHLHRLVDLICCWLKLHFSWCLTRLGRRL